MNEWTTIDKKKWGPGPWDNEVDKIHWIDPATDLDCLMVRHSLGHWCGYVAVTEGHPAFGKDYNDVDVRVHGGLTFADACHETGDPATGICHVPEPGRPHDVWWLGFDCAHIYDLSPGINAFRAEAGLTTGDPDDPDVYRDRTYVAEEVRYLARQLWAMAPSSVTQEGSNDRRRNRSHPR